MAARRLCVQIVRSLCPGDIRTRRRGAAAVEAAFCLPMLLILLLGLWQVGRMVQVSQILNNAAREGARYAALGNITINGDITPITAEMVQTLVGNYLTAAGLPNAAASGAQVTLTSSSGWTDPCNAQPLDKFQVTVTIPPGAAFNSVPWSTLSLIQANQLSASVNWVSLVDSQVSVGSQLPF